MKIKTREFVQVFYDPDLKNWDKVIEQELKRRGLRHDQVTLICKPSQRVKTGPTVKHFARIALAVADNQI